MDLYFLNFKRILVILSHKDMRLTILEEIKDQQVDVNIQFADSYSQAAKYILDRPFEPYNYIVLNTSVSNQKRRDFMEFAGDRYSDNKDLFIDYSRDHTLSMHEKQYE